MERVNDLAPVKLGDEVEAYKLHKFGLGTITGVFDDGTIEFEHKCPGRYVDDENGHFIELGCAQPGEFITTNFRARTEILANGERRFLVMSPAEYRTDDGVETTISPRQMLFNDVRAQLAKVAAANKPEISIEIAVLRRKYKIYKRHQSNQPMPDTGERVCATAEMERGDQTECVLLFGKVISSDQLGNVCVVFDRFTLHGISDDDFDAEARTFLGREIETHAVDMVWQDSAGEWAFDL